jgi:hypothetical protein
MPRSRSRSRSRSRTRSRSRPVTARRSRSRSRRRSGSRKKASAWIQHVKAYARTHNMKFGAALKKAGPSFKK